MSLRVLCVNVGLETAKLSVLRVEAGAHLGHAAAPEVETTTPLGALDDPHAYGAIDLGAIDVVAYRVVRVTRLPPQDAVPFDDALRSDILGAAEVAPLHTREVVAAADALRARAPQAAHVAVFDAGFHRTIPERAATYGLPYADALDGWRKIGFHGLSYAYVSARTEVLLGAAPARKLIALHLGGGCSAAAIAGGHSIDTTMGFTPTDGLIMATRAGSIDVGLLLAYMRAKRLTIDETEALVAEQSGLLGLGGSADMRAIGAARMRGDVRATLAYDVFVYRASAAIGALGAALHGVDVIAFAGGIGENAALVRTDICTSFGYLGVALDPRANAAPQGDVIVSSRASRVPVLRIHTREDWVMALAASHVARAGITVLP